MKLAPTFAVFSTRKNIWVRAGSARLEKDGSINIDLDVLPINGKLHLRPELVDEIKATPEIWAERTGNAREYSLMLRVAGEEPHQVGVAPVEEVMAHLASAALGHHARLAAPCTRELPVPELEDRT